MRLPERARVHINQAAGGIFPLVAAYAMQKTAAADYALRFSGSFTRQKRFLAVPFLKKDLPAASLSY